MKIILIDLPARFGLSWIFGKNKFSSLEKSHLYISSNTSSNMPTIVEFLKRKATFIYLPLLAKLQSCFSSNEEEEINVTFLALSLINGSVNYLCTNSNFTIKIINGALSPPE